MLGAIAGDVIGSLSEFGGTKSTDFELFSPQSRFTDDTVLTVATAHAILTGSPYASVYRDFGRKYPESGFGAAFYKWMMSDDPQPYNSWGNGSAMRVSPVGLAFDTPDDVLREAERSAVATHNHPEGVKGAQSTALAVFMARSGASKDRIREELTARFGYDLNRTIDAIRPTYKWDVSCQGSVPEAIIAFLDSRDVEDAIRLAISLGGDGDTQAAIAGGIAHAFYQDLPKAIGEQVRDLLPHEFLQIIDAFERKYHLPS